MESRSDDFEILNTDQVAVEQRDAATGWDSTPGVFLCEKFVGTLDRKTVAAIKEQQAEMLQKMEVSQMKVSHCLALSDQSYEHAAQVFKAHTRRLVSMKQDVESIHRRIRAYLSKCQPYSLRVLKVKLAKEYPEVVAENESKFAVHVRDDDDSDKDSDKEPKHSHDS